MRQKGNRICNMETSASIYHLGPGKGGSNGARRWNQMGYTSPNPLQAGGPVKRYSRVSSLSDGISNTSSLSPISIRRGGVPGGTVANSTAIRHGMRA